MWLARYTESDIDLTLLMWAVSASLTQFLHAAISLGMGMPQKILLLGLLDFSLDPSPLQMPLICTITNRS